MDAKKRDHTPSSSEDSDNEGNTTDDIPEHFKAQLAGLGTRQQGKKRSA